MNKLVAILCVVSWSGFWAFGYLALSAGIADDSQMVIAAPPQVLGAIRDRMPDALRGRVLAELDKTLTKHSMAGIAEIVAAALEG